MKYIIVAIITFLIISCNENSINPVKEDVLIPLKIGNYWINKKTVFNENDSNKNYVKYDTIMVDGWRKINNDTYYFYKGSLMINRIDGIHYFDNNDYFYKYPINIGEYFDSFWGAGVTLKSNDSLITIQGINYKCYVYYWRYWNSSESGSSFYVDICPGIGVIRSSQYDIEKTIETRLVSVEELQSYHLN